MGKDAYIWVDSDVNIGWTCKDITEVKEILKSFARVGIMLEEYKPSDTYPRWNLRGKRVTIILAPSWTTSEGANCKLVQVGTKEVPVYKLRCDKSIEFTQEQLPDPSIIDAEIEETAVVNA
jgi:hypothetical protein